MKFNGHHQGRIPFEPDSRGGFIFHRDDLLSVEQRQTVIWETEPLGNFSDSLPMSYQQ